MIGHETDGHGGKCSVQMDASNLKTGKKQRTRCAAPTEGVLFISRNTVAVRTNLKVSVRCLASPQELVQHLYSKMTIHSIQSCLVPAAVPCADEYAKTGVFVRGVMKLTNLDFVFVFDSPLQKNGTKRIQESLSQVLNHYPTLAGRMEGNRIRLNNQGARFRVQSHPGSSIGDIPVEPATGEPYCLIPIPREQIQGEAPLLTVTVTQFQDGWTLGVVINHLIADAWTFSMFLKDWSDVFNGQKIEEVSYQIPNALLETYPTQKEADKAAKELLQSVRSPWRTRTLFKLVFRYVMPWMMKDKDPRLGTTPNRLVLHYTESQIKQLKSQAEKKAETWVSTNEALMTHVWSLLLDAARLTPKERSNLGASYAVNLRSKFPQLPPRLAGNAVTSTTLQVDMDPASNRDPLQRRVHSAVRSSLRHPKLRAANRINNALWADNSNFITMYKSKRAGDLVYGGIRGVLSWNWQASNPYYQINFGTGVPCRGLPWSWTQPVTALPSPNGGIGVHIDKTDRGHVSWKRSPKHWVSVPSICALFSLSSYLGIVKLGANNRGGLTLWLVSLGALCVGAEYRSKRDAERSKQDFHDYIEKHSHRGINVS